MHAGCTAFSSTGALNACGRCGWMENPWERHLRGWMFACCASVKRILPVHGSAANSKIRFGPRLLPSHNLLLCLFHIAANHRLAKITQWELELNCSHISNNDAKNILFMMIDYCLCFWLLHAGSIPSHHHHFRLSRDVQLLRLVYFHYTNRSALAWDRKKPVYWSDEPVQVIQSKTFFIFCCLHGHKWLNCSEVWLCGSSPACVPGLAEIDSNPPFHLDRESAALNCE